VKAPAFAYVKPVSLAETFELLERYGDGAKVLAGGQSLMPALNMRLAAPRVLIDINGLRELAGIRIVGDTLIIGALTGHCVVERSPEVAKHLPLIHAAMPHVAHIAIRNRGTFGGSIAFADPAAELPACSLALDARFVVANSNGTRHVAARDFFRGLYETALEPGEILLAGEFPVCRPRYRSAFQELARRHGDYAIVGLAAHARVENGVFSDVRLAFFGVGATPLLARNAASALEDRAHSAATVADAQRALDGDLAPIDDIHHSAAARMHLARVLMGRVVAQLAQGALT
jgi:carbon-monoxide dehydrogenase medium subunit